MAITVVSSPPAIHAAYNPIRFRIDSDNKGEVGFRYIVRLYEAGSATIFRELKFAPDPTINGQVDIDISRIIQDKVDYYLDLDSLAVELSVGTYFYYDVKFGESMNVNWEYQDYVFYGGAEPGGNTSLTSDSALIAGGSDIPHPFEAGDQLFIQNDVIYGDDRDLLNGYFNVIDVVDTLTFAINLSGITDSGGAAEGNVRFADYRKLTVMDESADIDDLLAINAAQDVIEYSLVQGDLADYDLATPDKRFLTDISLVDRFYTTELQSMWVNMLDTLVGQNVFLYFENDGGDRLRKFCGEEPPVKTNSVGPGNLGTLSVVSGTSPLVKPDTLYYDFWVGDADGDAESEKIRLWIDRRCLINTTEILFMDRKGSFMSFAFQNREFETATSVKQHYRKYVNDYQTYSDGYHTYHSRVTKKIKLNSNFMNESMNYYYEQLVTSRYTLIKYEGIWYSCTVEDTTVENEKHTNNKMISKTLTVSLDMNSPIN